MESSEYVSAVCEFLRADGWVTDTPQLTDGMAIFTARQQPAAGDRSIIVLVVTSSESQLTPAHLAKLREAIQDLPMDGAVVTVEGGMREEVHQCAANYDRIRALAPETVYDSGGAMPPATETTSYLTRRGLLAGGVLAGGGLLSTGLLLRSGPGSEPAPAEPDPESIPYGELRTNTDQYVGANVFYFPTRIAEVIDSEADTQLFRIQVTWTGDGWKDDVVGCWDGDPYGENYYIQFTGRVAGTISYETEAGAVRTLPEIVLTTLTEL